LPLFFESTNRLPHIRETSLLAKLLNCVQKNQLQASELSLDMVCRVPGGDSPHSAPSCEVPLDRRLHQDASSAAASLGMQGDRFLLTSRPKHHTPPRPGRVAMESPRSLLCPPAIQGEEGWGGHGDGARMRCLSSLSHSETHGQKSSHSTWKVPSLRSLWT